MPNLSVPLATIDHSCPPPETLYNLQRQDSNLKDIINYLESNELPPDDKKLRSLLLPIDSFFLNDHRILCDLWSPGKRRDQQLCVRVAILSSMCHEILVACNDHCTASDLGITKTYDKIRTHYYWPNMFKDIEHCWQLLC